MKIVGKKLLLTLLAVGSFSLASASEMFVFQTTDVTIDDNKAKLYIGTPVKVLKSLDDKNSLVEFSGIVYKNEVYTNKNKSLIMASTSKNLGSDGEIKQIQAIISKSYLATDPVEIWEEHEEFFYDNCTQCHAAYEPKSHSMLEWDAILQTMNGFAQLDEEEANYLARFVKATASNGFYPEKK